MLVSLEQVERSVDDSTGIALCSKDDVLNFFVEYNDVVFSS